MELKQVESGLVLSAISIRKLIGWLGAALPLLCLAYAIASHQTVLHAISDYYYTRVHAPFVGILCILGACLFSYRGYSRAEDALAKLGGLCAVGTALCPTDTELTDAAPVVSLLIGPSAKLLSVMHGLFACSLFVIFMIFAAVFFTRTHESDKNDPLTFGRGLKTLLVTVFVFGANPFFSPTLGAGKERRNRIYRVCARFIAGAVLAVLLVALLKKVGLIAEDPFPQFMFACETVGLWAFAASWLTKAEQFAFLRDELTSDTPSVAK